MGIRQMSQPAGVAVAAIALLIMLGLFVTGTAYAAVAPQQTEATVTSFDSVANGKKLFVANCATCHGANGLGIKDAGPSLAGVGAASVDFQMGTGRMPMAAPGVGIGQNDGFVFQARAMLEEVAGLPADESLPRNADFADGLHNMELIAAVARSAVAGGAPVDVPSLLPRS